MRPLHQRGALDSAARHAQKLGSLRLGHCFNWSKISARPLPQARQARPDRRALVGWKVAQICAVTAGLVIAGTM